MIGQYKYSMYHHVYIKDGEIHTIRYKRMVDEYYIDGSFTDYEFMDGLYHGVTL